MSFNRDETKTKKTNPLAPFQDDQNIIAGRDLEGLGTWCGVNKSTGIVAFLTNFDCDGFHHITDLKYGRGNLTQRFLSSKFAADLSEGETIDAKIHAGLTQIIADLDKFNAFNLVVGNVTTNTFYYVCNPYESGKTPTPVPERLQEGKYYALTNTYLHNHEWQKVQQGLPRFETIVQKQISNNNYEPQISEEIENMQREAHENLMTDSTDFKGEDRSYAMIFVPEYTKNNVRKPRPTISSCFLEIDSQKQGIFSELYFIPHNGIEYSKENPLKTSIQLL